MLPLMEDIPIPATLRIMTSGHESLEGPFQVPSCLCSHPAPLLLLSNLPFTFCPSRWAILSYLFPFSV